MTRTGPPRLAMSLLIRCLPEDDPLTGDLVEEFAAGRSPAWFWWQTLAALVAAWHRPRAGVRPLRLVADPGRSSPDPRPRWPVSSGGPLAYLPAGPVTGVGSVGLLAVIVLVAMVVPQIGFLLSISLVAGVALGVLLVRRTARRMEREGTLALGHMLLGDGAAVGRR